MSQRLEQPEGTMSWQAQAVWCLKEDLQVALASDVLAEHQSTHASFYNCTSPSPQA